MDLSYFIERYANLHPADQIGLYCVQQKELPQRFGNIYRCGVAGSKEILDRAYGGSAESTFRSRFAMYLANWISDGKVFAMLTVPRSIHLGFSEKVLAPRNPDDRRENYALPGKTRAILREKQYHEALEKMGVKRYRAGRAEWFQGTLRQIKLAMRSIGVGNYYEFQSNVLPHEAKYETLTKADDLPVTRFDHRRSPRLLEVQMQKADIQALRAGDQRARRLARALAQLA